MGWQIDDTAGNPDTALEPGETARIQVRLFNDGNELATGIIGTLELLADRPDVTIVDKTATWPNLAARGATQLADFPGFSVQVASTLACGTVLPFRLEVATASGDLFDLRFSIKVGQRVDVDLVQDTARRWNEQDVSIWGADTGDSVGRRTAAGDINGDGYMDLVITAIGGDGPGAGTACGAGQVGDRCSAGEVILVYGGPGTSPDRDLLAPGSGIARFFGADASDSLATSVATGDLNGDGFDDIVLGSTNAASSGNARPSAGEFWLIYGKAAQWSDTDLFSTPGGTARFFGAEASDLTGQSVATGDINGDGFDEVLVGANGGDGPTGSRSAAGEVFVVHGRSVVYAGSTDLLSPPAGVIRIYGAESGDQLGAGVAAGDVNGDGYDDLVLGAQNSSSIGNTRTGAGEIVLVYGSAGFMADLDLAVSTAGTTRFYGATNSDLLGTNIDTGDVDGDGLDDIIAGIPQGDGPGDTVGVSGEVYIIYGRTDPWPDTDLFAPPADVARIWSAADVSDNLGNGLATGDLDGDGYDEVLMGSVNADGPFNGRPSSGEVVIVQGRPERWHDMVLSLPVQGVTIVYGPDSSDQAGLGIAAADLNGDGYDDLAIGVPGGDGPLNARSSPGEVLVRYGRPSDTYLARSDTFSFINATTGTLLPLSCDDCSVEVPIGFSFPFYSEEFTSLRVSSNGVIAFSPLGDLSSAIPVCMPDGGANTHLIAPFWDDLNPSAGAAGSGVYTLLEGTAPNRRLTIEWKDVPHYPAEGAATFEATLFESTGQILIQHQDLSFGNASFDNGQAAVTGVSNRRGAHGVPWSCFVSNVLAASTAVRYTPTTPLVESNGESGAAPFVASGLWHLTSGACAPDEHAGAAGWYYGQDGACTYNTGAANSGALTLPSIPDFPADGRLTWWFRRSAEIGSGFDQSTLQISTTGAGGPFGTIQQTTDPTNTWKNAGVTNLLSTPGITVDLRFHFDTVDGTSNGFLGWMLDDIQLTGCDAQGVTALGAGALAYATPAIYCEGGAGMTDAVGSYCSDSGVPSSYQWERDGSPIPGASAVTYAIPSSQPAGVYDYQVTVGCPGGAVAESEAARVTIVRPPANVGGTLGVTTVNGATQLRFNWTDVAGADDYVLFQDTAKNGAFTVPAGSAGSGAAGLTIPMPTSPSVYYLIAGRGAVCGVGPLR